MTSPRPGPKPSLPPIRRSSPPSPAPASWNLATPARWEDLHLVSAWRRFLTEPASYFRHLFVDDTRPADP
jgi:hypothetical protein